MSKLISEVTPYAPNGAASDYGLRASAVQYGTCSTAMTASAKVVTCATFTTDYLVEGSIIAVKFTAANSSNVNNEADPANFTLNVNNTGAKPIKYIYQGALNSLPAKGFLKQNRIYLFYYDGTNWIAIVSNDTDTIPVDIAVSGGTTELEWGETQTIVNINGTDIKLKMPENPDTNTTYTVTTTGSGNAVTSVTLSGTTITAEKGATYNNYTHPTHTSQELGLYKIEVDNLGHVASTTAASISDLPHNHDDVYLKLTGGTLTGTLTLSSAAATDSPALVFQRGTLSDNYNDWRLIDSGGYLHFQERGSGSSSWNDRVTMTTNGTVVATTFSGTATYATKASQDGSGNDIESTYATKSELSGYATSTHAHGNITTSGYMTTSATISSGDRLVITDSSSSHKMVTSTISFDGSTTTKALTQKGTWETFNNYTHPTYTSQEQKLYKVSVDTKGHVDSVATVSKADITALGIPGEDTNTTYTFTVSGDGSALSGITITGTTITFNKNYSHPTYTSQEQKLYKVSVDTLGHIDSVTTVSKADITALGIPSQNTTYTITTTGTGNAVTAVGLSGTTITVTKGATYNNYSHPTFTSQDTGFYKVKINEQGHVSSTTTVSKADITALGIPPQDTTYTFTKSGTGNALTGISVNGTTITFNSANYNNYSHPSFTSQELGFYKVKVNEQGHVNQVSTVTKSDITALGIPGEDTKVTNTVSTTTKYYVAGPTSSATSTAGQVFDTGVYVTSTAGELNATQYKVNEAVTLKYNSTTKSLDFIFA